MPQLGDGLGSTQSPVTNTNLKIDKTGTPGAKNPRNLKHRLTSFLGSEFFVLFLSAAACLIFAVTAPGFASRGNLWNIFISALPLLLLATGQTIVLITAGIDLSITATVGLSSIVGA